MQDLIYTVKMMEQAMREFRQVRAEVVSEEYYESHCDKNSYRIRGELYDKILRLLGKNKHLLIEFAERDADCLSLDTDYFYNCGFDDCLLFMRAYNRVRIQDCALSAFLERSVQSGGE